jgi:N-acetylmuramoyl-L-alanine amidase
MRLDLGPRGSFLSFLRRQPLQVSCLALLTLALFMTPKTFALRVLIDPGHGGRDQGARPDLQNESLTEARVVWDWSLDLKKALTERGFDVELSRNEKQGLSLKGRLDILKRRNYDFFISLHANSLLDPRVRGIEYFIKAPLNLEDRNLELAHQEIQIRQGQQKASTLAVDVNLEKKSQVSAILLDLSQQAQLEKSLEIAQDLNHLWPGRIKQGPFDLLTQSEVPALLIELGFLSNPTDLRSLNDPQFRQTKVTEIATVLRKHLRPTASSSVELNLLKGNR